MRRLLLVGALVAGLTASAEALTIRDIIELARAGVGDDVLIALIEVDRGVYAVDPATLKQLKSAGVSDRVMVALVRSGREVRVDPVPVLEEREPEAPTPQVVVIDHHDQPERVREVPVPVAVPVYVPVGPRWRHHRAVESGYDASAYVPFASGLPAQRPVPPQKTEPVYWGWGGKLRPDAWQPAPGEVRQPDRKK